MSSQNDRETGAIASRRTDGKATLKDLGRKARARLDEEKGKRHEIVRLEPSLANPEAKRKRNSSIGLIRPKKKQSKPTTKKRRISGAASSTKGSGSSTANRSDKSKNVDLRIPDVSGILLENQEKDLLSNVVRVHGIPLDATRSDVLRFFSGLDAEHVFLLPHNSSKIVSLDADDCPSSKARKEVIERHPGTFRAFVKFASAPTAALAAQRSGETLYLGNKTSNSDGDGHTCNRKGAQIAVTQVPKAVTRYIQRNMSIECRTNLPLDEELFACEAKLNDLVPQILWSAARQDLKLQEISPADEDDRLDYHPIDDSQGLLLQDPSTEHGYTALVDLHNAMLKDYESLTTGTPFPSVALCNSSELLRDPSIKLTNTAAKHLKERIQHIDDYLHMARNLLNRRRNGAPPSIFDSLVPRKASFKGVTQTLGGSGS
ncbi:expressed unknown protein [Seminavis robusta]|uniref:RRM domain-containing protein n=1 Tax=Seminavis robusta TaxID=568900 RepID=A0A9N8DL92_9STRA|nr:expressed unknown protein [Seminavis robusta]|eukprot:Sro216_g089490.1 n/a (431) ;mRNA; r:66647-68027